MRSIAKTINTHATSIARFAIGPITDQSRAKQRRNFDVVVTLRQMKAVSCIRNGELGVTAIEGVTGKARVIAKVLPAGSAIRAIAIGPAKPRDSHAIADCEGGSGLCAATVRTLRSLPHSFADFFDSSDNLVPENQWQLRIGQFAVDHVEVGAANRAAADPHEQLSLARLRLWNIARFQKTFRFVENHGAHKVNNNNVSTYSYSRCCKIGPKNDQEQEEDKLARSGWHGSHLPFARACHMFTFVLVVVGATEEGHLVKYVLLEPFEPEINNWCDE
jgi:hypothetical protein